MASLIAIALNWWKAGVGAIVGALLCLPLAYCSGASDMKGKMEARWEAEKAAVERRNAQAIEAAAEQRAKDIVAATSAQQERDNAIHAGSDEAPSGPELRLACERLRQQGTAANRLPAACRSGGAR